MCYNGASPPNMQWTNIDSGVLIEETIAQTVVAFVEDHPKAVIMAKGSTPSRTRLYQMGKAQFWDEIGKMFEVKGLIDNEWQSFEKGKNTNSLCAKRKYLPSDVLSITPSTPMRK